MLTTDIQIPKFRYYPITITGTAVPLESKVTYYCCCIFQHRAKSIVA